MARKMEELAYEAANKVYAKDDTGPYDCLRYVSPVSHMYQPLAYESANKVYAKDVPPFTDTSGLS